MGAVSLRFENGRYLGGPEATANEATIYGDLRTCVKSF